MKSKKMNIPFSNSQINAIQRRFIPFLAFLWLFGPANGQLDPASFIPEDAPVSALEVYEKPYFGYCEDSEDYMKCVKAHFNGRMAQLAHRLGFRYNPPDTLRSQFYFEVTPEKQIENIKVESNYGLTKVIIEHFIADSLRVLKPARDSLGNPVRTYWHERFYKVYSNEVRQEIRRQATHKVASKNFRFEKISPNVYQHTSYLETEEWGRVACNGIVVVLGNEALVIDTPVNVMASKELLKVLTQTMRVKVLGVVATHFHEDCLGGLQAFHDEGIFSYSIGKTRALAEKAGYVPPKAIMTGRYTFSIDGEPVHLGYYGAGHTEDNIVAYFPKDRVLFGGCLVKSLGAGKGNLADADVKAWPETVRKVMEAYPEVEVVVPGHGKTGGKELLEFTIGLFKSK